jgi:hypothetical protein
MRAWTRHTRAPHGHRVTDILFDLPPRYDLMCSVVGLDVSN